MSNTKSKLVLTEEEYRKKVLTPLYESKEPRDIIIDRGKKEIEELIDAEKRVVEQMEKFAEKYKDM